MKSPPASPSRIPRRAALTGLGCAAAVAAGAVPLWAGTGLGQGDLHDRVVARIRARFPAGARDLSLLIPHGSRANIEPVAVEFTARTGIGITISEAPIDGINTELTLNAMLTGHKYDVALPATYGLPDLTLAGAIRPLDDFAKAHEPDGFREGILYPVGDSFDGRIYGFQTDGDAYLMFYNQQMMQDPAMRATYADRYGAALDVPLTWPELDRQMAFFHNPDAGRYGGILYRTPGPLIWEFWVRFHAKGVWPLAPDMTPQIDGDAGLAAVEEMIAATRHLLPKTGTMGFFQNWERYGRGDVYANIGWGGTQKYLNGPKSQVRGKLVFGPTPGGMLNGRLVSMPYFNWGWCYAVTTTSDLPELAYLFSLFASSPAMSTLAVRQQDGFFDPFRPEHYADPGIVAAYSEPFLKVQRASLEGAIPDLYLKGQSEYFSALAGGLDRALQGDATPQSALTRIAQNWELVTSRAGRRGQIARWERLRAKYPPTISTCLRDLS